MWYVCVSVVAQITSPSTLAGVMLADPNGNHDSGYAPSNVEETQLGCAGTPTTGGSPHVGKAATTGTGTGTVPSKARTGPTVAPVATTKSGGGGGGSARKRNGVDGCAGGSPKKEPLRYAGGIGGMFVRVCVCVVGRE